MSYAKRLTTVPLTLKYINESEVFVQGGALKFLKI